MDFYLLALIIGGGLLLLSLLGGHGSDLDLDLDPGAGADLSPDLSAPPHGAAGDPSSGNLASWFSMRALVSFLAFFGLAGVLGRLLGLSGTVQLLTALVTGLLAGAATASAFRLARRHGNVSFEAATLVGRVGTVVVPLHPGRLGRVALELGAQQEQLAARSEVALTAGQQVIVTAEDAGVLEVQPWDSGRMP
ncbi:NfeD family protein [Deinococcus sp. Marseille-Q6407]|uniref:NfeD family protein n=1 Tax=Deinococcus sp. Marseille-Q6407 TaxID=2969223 RepID=UPI0021BE865B|nr:hypothetical protein [Deinococcus sp. Marseille-Q6407]